MNKNASNQADQIIGLRVADARLMHDYLQIEFQNGTTLSVFNRHKMQSHKSCGAHSFIGTTLLAHYVSQDVASFEFSGEISLSVGMMDSDYLGPEAMTLTDR